jgi:hypothetical protein
MTSATEAVGDAEADPGAATCGTESTPGRLASAAGCSVACRSFPSRRSRSDRRARLSSRLVVLSAWTTLRTGVAASSAANGASAWICAGPLRRSRGLRAKLAGQDRGDSQHDGVDREHRRREPENSDERVLTHADVLPTSFRERIPARRGAAWQLRTRHANMCS